MMDRPAFPANTVTKVNPKVAATYRDCAERGCIPRSAPASARPPAWNWRLPTIPALKPERTASFDFGVEQRVLHDKLSLDATYFYNRFYDLIVSLGGNLAVLSAFETDNLSNARAQGAEVIAPVPAGALDVVCGFLHLSGFGGPVAEWFHGTGAGSVLGRARN